MANHPPSRWPGLLGRRLHPGVALYSVCQVLEVLERYVVQVALRSEVRCARVFASMPKLVGCDLHCSAHQFGVVDATAIHWCVYTRDLAEDVVRELVPQTVKSHAQS